MKKEKRVIAGLMAMTMVLSLAACGGGSASSDSSSSGSSSSSSSSADSGTAAEESEQDEAAELEFGPIYDEWSDMTDEELYEKALEEVQADGGVVTVYATSSKMLKVEEDFEEAFPGLDLEIMDLDSDEVLEKCVLEADAGNVYGDVLQVKDTDGTVFYEYYDDGYVDEFYPRDICQYVDEDLLAYGYPLYASQSFWYYNTAAFPDGQPVNSWWEIIETDESGNQKYRLFSKEIGTETTYLSLLASFIGNADAMEQAYKDAYGEDLEYTYDASSFSFEVPENNAGVEFIWRLSQMKITFISDGDELVLAVHNSTADDPALALASGGKVTNRDESGYDIAWCTNLTPYTGLQNCEYMYVVANCPHPAAARLFIRWVTGGSDGESGGLKPFSKEGNYMVRSDVEDDWNPVTLDETGGIEPDLAYIYSVFMDAQDLWTYWLDQNPHMG